MRQTKLLSVLEVLHEEEWKSLTKYLLQFCRETSDIFRIFLFFKKQNETKTLGIPQEFDGEFSGISKKIFSNLMSTLFKWTQEWLVAQEVLREDYAFDLYLIKSYNRRAIYRLADQTAMELEKKIKNKSTLDIENSYSQFKMLQYQFFSNNPIKYDHGTAMLSDLQDSFLTYVKEQLLDNVAGLQNWQKIRTVDFYHHFQQSSDLDQCLPDSELSEDLKSLINMIAYYDLSAFLALKEKLLHGRFELGSQLHNKITYYLIAMSQNLNNKNLLQNKGDIFQIYEYALTSGVLLDNGKISHITFNNMITILSTVETYQRNMDFIEKWISLVEGSKKETNLNIAKAIVSFYHEYYDAVLYHTNIKDFGSFSQRNLAFVLRLIACFMDRKNDYDRYKDHLNKFILYMKRNKSKFSVKNFIAYTNLIDFIIKIEKSTKRKVCIDLSQYEFLMYRSWCEKMVTQKGS